MCTLTILRRPNHVIATMNRDESWAREPEIPPAIHENHWCGPLDGQAGGTWIGVNADGLVAALLNGYSDADNQSVHAPVRSRGHLVPEALHHADVHEMRRWLRSEVLATRYRGFRLIVADAWETLELHWDGARLVEQRLQGDNIVVASSSWNQRQVVRWRIQYLLGNLSPSSEPDDVLALHGTQIPGREYWGPRVSRLYAGTRSITQIVLTHPAHQATVLHQTLAHRSSESTRAESLRSCSIPPSSSITPATDALEQFWHKFWHKRAEA